MAARAPTRTSTFRNSLSSLSGPWPTSPSTPTTPITATTATPLPAPLPSQSYITHHLHTRRASYLRPRTTTIKTATWNIGNFPTTSADLRHFLAPLGEPKYDIYILALQEVVDVTNTTNFFLPTDPKVALTWRAHAQAALPDGYECVATTQLIGMLTLVFAKPGTVGGVETCAVGTGLMGYVGNKGAVAVRLVLGEATRVVVVNCHLAAFENATERRNWDAGEVERRVAFEAGGRECGVWEEGGRAGREGLKEQEVVVWCGDLNYRVELEGEVVRRCLEPLMPKDAKKEKKVEKEGDRVGEDEDDEETEDEGQKMLDEGTLESLLRHDQLRKVRKEGKALKGYREGKIAFLPTYKYDPGTVATWDSSEKARVPSWCDRVLWKLRGEPEEEEEEKEEDIETRQEGYVEADRKDETVFEHKSEPEEEDDDDDEDDLVVSRADTPTQMKPPSPTTSEFAKQRQSVDLTPLFDDSVQTVTTPVGDITIEETTYIAYQNVTSSDHKPVVATFTLTYPAVDPDLRQKVHAEIAREADKLENERRPLVTIIIEPSEVSTFEIPSSSTDENFILFGETYFWEEKHRHITLANTGTCSAHIHFVSRPDPDEPSTEITCKPWLKITFPDGADPVKGIHLEPGDTTQITLILSITIPAHVAALNDKSATLDDVLILRVADGRDYFLPISATWHPTSFATPLDTLVRIPENPAGFRGYLESSPTPTPADTPIYSAPRELYRITSYLLSSLTKTVQTLGPDEEITSKRWYSHPGWPFVDASPHRKLQADIWNAVDTDTPFPAEDADEDTIEAVAAVLLQFLHALPESVVPETLWDTVVTQGGGERDKVLDAMPNVHANVFISLVGFVGEVVRVLAEKRPVAERERVLVRVVEVVAPALVRRPGKVQGGKKGAEERRGRWVRRWLEM